MKEEGSLPLVIQKEDDKTSQPLVKGINKFQHFSILLHYYKLTRVCWGGAMEAH